METREVSGAIVYTIVKGQPYILLVSKREGEWVSPKGGIEPELSARESAAKEAMEEAGVLGKVGACLGSYQFLKGKKVQNVVLYAMQYQRALDEYPEMALRKRRWFEFDDAMKLNDRYQQVFLLKLKTMLEDAGQLSAKE